MVEIASSCFSSMILIYTILPSLFRVKELGPEDNKKGGEDYVAFDDTPDVVSPTLSSGDPAVNNADLALLCTHSVSNPFYNIPLILDDLPEVSLCWTN